MTQNDKTTDLPPALRLVASGGEGNDVPQDAPEFRGFPMTARKFYEEVNKRSDNLLVLNAASLVVEMVEVLRELRENCSTPWERGVALGLLTRPMIGDAELTGAVVSTFATLLASHEESMSR